MENNELVIMNKKNEVTKTIEDTVANYYNIDITQNTAETMQKKQNIAMFVSKLITTQNKDKQPAILTASADSIRECALAFVNGDFDFFRNQAYLIAYGTSLQFIVSKDGLVSGAKKVIPNLELFSDIVYKDDIFEFTKVGGRTLVTKHDQPLKNITGKIEDIVCAYACAWKDGVQIEANIMTMDEIKGALATAKRSITDFHKNNPKIMLGKFPLRQLCKKIINQNIAPEVAKVLGDEDTPTIVVEAQHTPIAEPVELNFETKAEPTKRKSATKKAEEPTKIEATPTSAPYQFEDSVSMFDLQNQETIGSVKTIDYDDWLPIYKPMGIYEPLKETYDKETNTVGIRRIK